MNTSTTRTECMNIPLVDFVQYYEDLANEAERESEKMKKQQEGR